MKQKYKLTGFARLVIFLIFFLPIAYFGTKIYKGEMTFADISDFVQDKVESVSKDEIPTKTPETSYEIPETDCETLLKERDREIKLLKRRIATLEK